MDERIDLKKWRKRGHRTRRSSYKRIVVLNRQDLAQAFECEPDEVEAQLKDRDIRFHRDSLGEVWASLEV